VARLLKEIYGLTGTYQQRALHGSLTAHFRIVSKLGEGGMGAVYRATGTKLNRDVAIKVLPEALASDAGRMARFEGEAQLLASINHPNIAAILRDRRRRQRHGVGRGRRSCRARPRGNGHSIRPPDRCGTGSCAREGHYPLPSEAGEHQGDTRGHRETAGFRVAARAMRFLLYGLQPYDVRTLARAVLLLVISRTARVIDPAAARLDPMAALRGD